MRLRVCTSALLAFALLGAPAARGAEPSEDPSHEQGKDLAVKGFEAYKAGNFTQALDFFQQARDLYPTGQVLRMLGYSLLALERWLEAADVLEQALRADLKPLPDADRTEVQGNLDKALSHLAKLTIRSDIAGATVSLDGRPPETLPVTERRLVEGPHSLLVQAPERVDIKREIELEGGEVTALQLDPPAKPTERGPAPEPEPSAGWQPGPWQALGLGLGAAGLALGALGVGLLVDGLADEQAAEDQMALYRGRYAQGCPPAELPACTAEADAINGEADRAASRAEAGIGLSIAGGLLAVVGVTVVLAGPTASEGDEGAPRGAWGCGPAGPLGLGCRARF